MAEGRLVSLLAPRTGCRRSTAPGLLEVSPSGSSLPLLSILLPTCITTHMPHAPTHHAPPPPPFILSSHVNPTTIPTCRLQPSTPVAGCASPWPDAPHLSPDWGKTCCLRHRQNTLFHKWLLLQGALTVAADMSGHSCTS